MAETEESLMINELPPASRPRERLQVMGPEALSDQELLAIILRTGYRYQNALNLALVILKKFNTLYELKQASLEELQEIKGVGLIKATELQASLELGQRLSQAGEVKQGKIFSSEQIGKQMILELKDYRQEHLIALYLNTKNEIIKQVTLFIGSLNQSVAHPREIFRGAVRVSAARLILVHNHPSGNPEPSETDIQFTKRVAACGEMMGIDLVDHVIVGETSFVSLRAEENF